MKLIIINGPCGVGKSTLAKKVHEKIPLSVLVEMDALRRNIADYKTHRKESGFLMFELTLGIIERALRSGSDVIIDKIIFDYPEAPKDYLNEFFMLAQQYDAQAYELILMADKDVVIDRVEKRGFLEGNSLTIEKVEKFYDAIEKFISKRKNAKIIDTTDVTEDAVFAEAWNVINT